MTSVSRPFSSSRQGRRESTHSRPQSSAHSSSNSRIKPATATATSAAGTTTGCALPDSALLAIRSADVSLLETNVKKGLDLCSPFPGRDQFTALHWAALHGSIECLQWLLWQKADVEARSQHQWTALHVAAIRGRDACIQALLAHGASHQSKDDRGMTACHLAAVHGHSRVVQTLLRAGVEVNATDFLGWSPVHAAAYHGRLGALCTLVRWGGDLSATDGSGHLAGHHAASQGHLPCLKYIMSAVKDARFQLVAINDDAQTMAHLAHQFQKQACADYLNAVEWETEHPADEQTSLAYPGHAAAYRGNLDVLHMLLSRCQVGIGDRDDRGATLVHKAAGNGQVECLKYLMEHGADVSLLNNAGETAKDIARRYAQLACVALLGGGESDDEHDIACPPLHHEEARERSRAKIRELQGQLELAKTDYEHLGGDCRELEEDADAVTRASTRVQELEETLEYERLRREELESRLDEARAEIAALKKQASLSNTQSILASYGTVQGKQQQQQQQRQLETTPAKAKRKTQKRLVKGSNTSLGVFYRQQPPSRPTPASPTTLR